MSTEPHEFTLQLRAERGPWRTAPTQRLRLALKCLLRAFGLRCTSVAPIPKPGCECDICTEARSQKA